MQNELAYYAGLSGLSADRSLADHKLAYFRTQSGLAAGLSSADYERSWLGGLYPAIGPDLDALRRHHFRTLSGLADGLSTADYARVVFSGGGAPPDVTPPTAGTLASSNITSTTFDLTVSGAADETALHAQPYRFSTDNGSTWSPYQTSPVFNVTGKTASTAYTCVHQTRDAAGNVATGSSIVVNTSAAASLTGTYQTVSYNESDLTVYSFTGLAIGAAEANRRVVVIVGNRGDAIDSATIGGVAATIHGVRASTSALNECAIISAVVPTGTVADVVITLVSSAVRCTVGVWAITGGPSTIVDTQVGAETDPSTVTLTTQVGDIVIAGCQWQTGTGTWTGGTEQFEQAQTGNTFTGGADVVASGASTAVTWESSSASPTDIAFIGVAIRAA